MSKRSALLVSVIALFVATIMPASADTNLVTNGSFESPIVTGAYSYDIYNISADGDTNIGGWTTHATSGTGVVYVIGPDFQALTGVTAVAPDGNQFIELPAGAQPNTTSTSIYQTLPTVVGQVYTVGFWLGVAAGCTYPSNLQVGWGDKGTGSFNENFLNFAIPTNTLPAVGYQWMDYYSFDVTADSASDTIQFASNLVHGSMALDNISVTPVAAPVPEPSGIMALLCGTASLVGLRLRRRN